MTIRGMAYTLLKEAGICVRCMSEWAFVEFQPDKKRKQHVICHGCLQYWKKYHKTHPRRIYRIVK